MPELKSEKFLDAVVRPNFELAVAEPDNERHMVNAVLTLDACIGFLHRDFLDGKFPSIPARDDIYRDQLSDKNPDYRILRDLAAAYKHGELTGPKIRSVRSSSQISIIENQLGFFECGDELGGDIVIIETSDGAEVRASDILLTTLRMQIELIDKLKKGNGL